MFDWSTVPLPLPIPLSSKDMNHWNCVIPLQDHVIIVVKGPDAEKFLQGQCTCDFKAVANQEFSLGAHCNPKGRMISSFTTAKIDNDAYGLRVHASIAEIALAALKKYAVFSKVELEISTSLGAVCIFYTENTPLPLFQTELEAGKSTYQSGVTHLAHSNTVQEVWACAEEISTLPASLPVASTLYWSLYAISEGIAEVTKTTTEALIPQEVNMQLTGGVSFTKGCYTGQEIIARMHYKATLKKHMYRAIVGSPEASTGTAVVNSEGKSVGKIVQSSTEGAYTHVLALVNDTNKEENNAYCDTTNREKLQWLPLPYAIPLTET